MFEEGNTHKHSGDLEEARNFYEQAVLRGNHAGAMHELGEIFGGNVQRGWKPNYNVAIEMYNRAIQGGHTESQTALGNMLGLLREKGFS